MKLVTLTAAAGCGVAALFLVTYSSGQAPAKFGNVSQARVQAETARGEDWLVAGGGFGEQHFTPLKQINDRNIATLGLAWTTDIDSAMGLATEPIVVDGIIYVSLPQSKVYAVEARSGRVRWRFDPKV